MSAAASGDEQLGADTVCGVDDHRVGKLFRVKRDVGGKAAEAAKHLFFVGAGDELFDLLNKGVASVDTDPCLTVSVGHGGLAPKTRWDLFFVNQLE